MQKIFSLFFILFITTPLFSDKEGVNHEVQKPPQYNSHVTSPSSTSNGTVQTFTRSADC